MPSNWKAIDTNFPTFTGEESPTQQIRALHNYLFQLREGLQYSLQNLTADNFNAAALQNLSDAQKNEVTEQLQKVYTLLNQMSAEINSLSGRVSGTEDMTGRVTSAEEEISYLEARADVQEEKLTGLDGAIAENENGIQDLDSRVTDIEGCLSELELAADELTELQDTVSGVGGLIDQMDTAKQEIKKISDALKAADGGGYTVGNAGMPLYLVGQIYINGVLYEQGGTE